MKISLTLLLIIFCCNAHSQKILVSEPTMHDYQGPLEIVPIDSGYIGIKTEGGVTDNDFALNRRVKHSITLYKYDTAFVEQSVAELEGEKRAFGPFKPVLKRINNQTHLFFFRRTDGENQAQLHHAFVTDDLQLVDAKKLVDVTLVKVGWRLLKETERCRMELSESPDHSKLLIIWVSQLDNRYSYTIVDKKFNILQSKTAAVEGVKKLTLGNACVDNEGSAYFAFRSNEIIVHDLKGNSRNMRLDINSASVFDVFLSTGVGIDSIFIAGVLQTEKGEIAGVFSQQLSQKTLLLSSAREFPLNALVAGQLRQQIKNEDKHAELVDMKFTPAPTEQGRLDLVGEARLWVEVSTSNASITNFGHASYVYCQFGRDSVRFVRIPRVTRYNTMPDLYLHPYKDKSLVFYVDIDSCLVEDFSLQKKLPKYRPSGLFVAFLTEDGVLTRQVVTDSMGMPFLGQQGLSGKNSVIIPCPSAYLYSKGYAEPRLDGIGKKASFGVIKCIIE